MISNNKFDRRRFLINSSKFLALPLFQSLYPYKAFAQTAVTLPPSCIWLVFPEGVQNAGEGTARYIDTNYEQNFNRHIWELTGSETNFQLPTELSAVLPYKNDILFATHGFCNTNYNNTVGGVVGHNYSTSTLLTNTTFTQSSSGFTGTSSIDFQIAEKLGLTSSPSWLVVGSDGAFAEDRGQVPGSSLQFDTNKGISYKNSTQLADKLTNLQTVFDRIFPGGPTTGSATGSVSTPTTSSATRNKKSILDFLRNEANSLKVKLNNSDGIKLDEYLTSIREIELRLPADIAPLPMPTASQCISGARPSNLAASDLISGYSPATFEAYTNTMLQLIYLAVACGRSRVITYLMDQDRTVRILPGMTYPHHSTHHWHDGANDTEKIEMRRQHRVATKFYLNMFASLVDKMKNHDLGNGKSLLDTTMISFSSCMASDDHSHRGIPVMIAGRGGGMRPGRYISGAGYQNNGQYSNLGNLWLGMAKKMGTNITGLGNIGGITGPVDI